MHATSDNSVYSVGEHYSQAQNCCSEVFCKTFTQLCGCINTWSWAATKARMHRHILLFFASLSLLWSAGARNCGLDLPKMETFDYQRARQKTYLIKESIDYFLYRYFFKVCGKGFLRCPLRYVQPRQRPSPLHDRVLAPGQQNLLRARLQLRGEVQVERGRRGPVRRGRGRAGQFQAQNRGYVWTWSQSAMICRYSI